MRKVSLILSVVLVVFTLESCLENENSIVSTSIIDLNTGRLPDTVYVNTIIPVSLRASVPNSCWHSITFYSEVAKDTIIGFMAKATFENHGEVCNEVITSKDTVINIPITVPRPHIFQFIESFNKVRTDTVIVRVR